MPRPEESFLNDNDEEEHHAAGTKMQSSWKAGSFDVEWTDGAGK
jgi:hypothetical protein